jgi:hypothetical protein
VSTELETTWIEAVVAKLEVLGSVPYGPYGSRRLRFPEFLDNRHAKVVKLSALSTGRLYPPGDWLSLHHGRKD